MTRPTAEDTINAARRAFERLASRPPDSVAFAPGRVNLVGEHTDYNDGFVLPMAIDEGIAAAFARRPDRVLRVQASEVRQTREIDLASLRGPTEKVSSWFRYAAGVAWAMQEAGALLTGVDIALAANLPSGAGLSSSAALELAVARALTAAAGREWNAHDAAQAAQRAEHEFVGVACGIMDQMAVACARAGMALLLDCRSLDVRWVPLPSDVRIVIMHSGVRRSLATSAYNDRRASCERAVAAVREIEPGVTALRDVDAPLLERARDRMDEVTYRRALHVVVENGRPDAFAAAMAERNLDRAGRVMAASHASLRDLYEVSCPELDALVTIASRQPGCHGARLTGAGFGGCAIALVENSYVERFSHEVAQAYDAATSLRTEIIVGRASTGVRLVS